VQLDLIAISCIQWVKKYFGLALTGLAKAVYDEVFKVSLEAVLAVQVFGDVQEQIFFTLNRFPAFLADQMVVMAFFSVVINEMIAGLAFDHTAGFFQGIQGAIDGRFIDARHFGPHLRNNIVRRQVIGGIMNDFHNQTPLGSQLVTFFLECFQATHLICTWLQL
jgi:hypothetical protein